MMEQLGMMKEPGLMKEGIWKGKDCSAKSGRFLNLLTPNTAPN